MLIKGKPETTTTTTIKAEQLSVHSLIISLVDYQRQGKLYLLGQLVGRNISSHPPEVEVSGTNITLQYATPDSIKTWPKQPLRSVDITVQLRHAPDSQPPKLTIETHQKSNIPMLLQRWVKNQTTTN